MFTPPPPTPDLAPKVGDRIEKTTCYMCACRCGIDVHLKEGRVAHIEGNRDHPKNRGVLCAKGSAGVMQHLSPARLRAPMKRVGPRGSGAFAEITWAEALETAVAWLKPVRAADPKKLAFFTGRDQSQSLTGWFAQQFGTPNFAAHGGFCSVNMAAAGITTLGGAFWEFGAPDWERAEILLLFGVAEDHDSNPIKMGLSRLKARGAKIVAVNPVRTGYNAVADEWVGITPGTDGLFALSLAYALVEAGRIDVDYLRRYTDAAWLVIEAPGAPDHGLIARDADGGPLARDRRTGAAVSAADRDARPDLRRAATLPDGRAARPVFAHLLETVLRPEHAPERAEAVCGVPAATIRRLAAELAEAAFEREVVIDQPWTDWRGERHERMVGRPVAMHAMRGISAHSNGFQTCRAIHMLQILLGAVETPGGFRFKPPYPKPLGAHPRPHGGSTPDTALKGPHLGFPRGPEDLLVEADGTPQRIDGAFGWAAPMAAHGMMHMVISNAAAQEPYGIDVLFLYMANMAWNSSMNSAGVMEMLTRTDESGDYVIPKIIYSDAYSSEMVAYADLILPDTTYLERHDCISLLDRPISEADMAADAIRRPVVEPKRDHPEGVRGFQSVLLDLGARLGLPGFVDENGAPAYADYADYMTRHERRPGVGPLAGWRGADGSESGRGAPNPDQLARYAENGGVFTAEIPEEARFFKPWNAAYQDWAVAMGFYDAPQPYALTLWSEPLRRFQLAAEGHGDRQPPDPLRARIRECFSPLPLWHAPFGEEGAKAFPLHAITQRPAAMYHAWGSQNAWLRQIHGENPLYVPEQAMRDAGLAEGDWAWVISPHGRIKAVVRGMRAVNPRTVWTWNAIGKRAGAWALGSDAPEAERGVLLNHLIHELLPPKGDGLRWSNSDPVTGQAAWYDLRVRLEKADAPGPAPRIAAQRSPVGRGPDALAWGEP